MEKLQVLKSEYELTSELKKSTKSLKNNFLNILETFQESKNYYPITNQSKILKNILTYLLKIQNFYGITRNKNFQTWGFEKKNGKGLNSIYLMLETLHNCKEIDLEFKKMENYEIEKISKNLFLKFENENVFCLSFKYLVDRNVENNVFLMFSVEDCNLEYLKQFFLDDFFRNFRNYFFRKLFGIFIKMDTVEYSRKKFIKDFSKIEFYLTVFAFQIYIFESAFKNTFNFFIQNQNLNKIEKPFFSLDLDDYQISIIGKSNDNHLKYNLFNQRREIENYFSEFLMFLENHLKKLNNDLKNDNCCYLKLNLEKEVIYYKNTIENNSVFFNNNFENNEELDFYIKKLNILQEIKRYSNSDFFLKNNNLFKKIIINDIEVKIMPNFIFKNKKNIKNGFIVKIKNLYEENNSDSDGSSIDSNFSLTDNKKMDYLKVDKKKKNWEDQYSEKKSYEIFDKKDDDSINISSNSDINDISNYKKSKSKNFEIKFDKSYPKNSKNLSSLEKLRTKKIKTFEIKQDTISIKQTINKKEQFIKKIIQNNSNISKDKKKFDPIDKLMSKIQNQLDNKLKIIESLNTLELSIDKTIKDLKVENIENTIFVEYVKSNKFSKQGSLYPHKAQVLKRKSVLPDYFKKNSNISFDQISKKSENEDLFQIYKPILLLKYKLDFLSVISKKNMMDSVYTMFQTSGIIEQFKIPLKKLKCYLIEAERFYSKHENAYHNFAHGLTVLNGCYYFLMNSEAYSFFDDTGVAAFLFGSLMHDVDHPGHNNDFEINSYGDIALLYNNQHVLENHHCFTAFKLLKKNNFFENMESKNEFMVFRKITIELILMTDPKNHLEHLNKLEKLIKRTKKEEFKENVNFDNFIALAGVMVHAADLHGPVKCLKEAKKWSNRIKIEFLEQLENEEKLGIPVTGFFKDLNNTKKSIINELFFIGNIVKPLYVVINDFFEKRFDSQVEEIENNLVAWKNQLEEVINKEKQE